MAIVSILLIVVYFSITAGSEMVQTHLTDVKFIKNVIKMCHVIPMFYGGQPHLRTRVHDDVTLSFIRLK